MAVTAAFLASCRSAIVATAEYTAFNTAYALYASASRSSRANYWYLAYGDNQAGLSPAYRLRKAIRDTVLGLADSTVTPTERESAYRTLAAEYVQDIAPPMDQNTEKAALEKAILEDQLS